MIKKNLLQLAVFFPLACILIIANGCKIFSKKATTVYLAGYARNTSGDYVPCYWKNGVRTDVDKFGDIYSIFVAKQ